MSLTYDLTKLLETLKQLEEQNAASASALVVLENRISQMEEEYRRNTKVAAIDHNSKMSAMQADLYRMTATHKEALDRITELGRQACDLRKIFRQKADSDKVLTTQQFHAMQLGFNTQLSANQEGLQEVRMLLQSSEKRLTVQLEEHNTNMNQKLQAVEIKSSMQLSPLSHRLEQKPSAQEVATIAETAATVAMETTVRQLVAELKDLREVVAQKADADMVLETMNIPVGRTREQMDADAALAAGMQSIEQQAENDAALAVAMQPVDLTSTLA